VAGWCDVVRKPIPSMVHSGVLGMGVLPQHRGKGLGRALMAAALTAARDRGITRVELTVRTDNTRARKLYESFGFTVEGLCRSYMRIDGTDIDSYLMALVP
jgi:ribosomal protein S18 acetylase RimI-like enzyme